MLAFWIGAQPDLSKSVALQAEFQEGSRHIIHIDLELFSHLFDSFLQPGRDTPKSYRAVFLLPAAISLLGCGNPQGVDDRRRGWYVRQIW
jgi:hypothetical protein